MGTIMPNSIGIALANPQEPIICILEMEALEHIRTKC